MVLVHTSVTLETWGSLAIDGGFGNPGATGAPGAVGAPGIAGIPGAPGIFGICAGFVGGSVNRLPSTSWPSIIDLPKSSTCMEGGWPAAAGICPAIEGAAPAAAGAIGIIVASFLT